MKPEALARTLESEWYRELLDAAPEAMFFVVDGGRLVLVNARAEDAFGAARAGFLGRPLDAPPRGRCWALPARHVARFLALPATCAADSGADHFRERGRAPRAEASPSLVRVGGARGLLSTTVRDLGDLGRAEAAPGPASALLAGAIESLGEAFALFDVNGELVLCNCAYRDLADQAVAGPLVGRRYDELLDASLRLFTFDDEAACERFRAARADGRDALASTCDATTRDGRRLRIATRKTPEGGIVETVCDVTEDARCEEELRRARRAAEASSEAKSEFLSSMSHELRDPLNAVLGFAQLLERDAKEPLSARHRERVEQILKGSEHLLRLLDDILDLSRIEAGGVSITAEPVSVPEVLDRVKTTLEPAAARAGVLVELAPPPAELPMVVADRTRFAQILMNFGTNAIKYNRPGGSVTFTPSMPSPERVRVTVSDTGMGIADAKQGSVFEPFQRAGQETGPIEGTGLGLALSKRLAERMRGCVGFRSAPCRGSQFWVDLPAHGSDARAGVPAAPRDEPRGPRPDGGGRQAGDQSSKMPRTT